MLIKKYTLSANVFILLICVYIVGVFNFPFFSKAFKAIVSLDTYNLLFLFSVPFLLLSLVTIIISLFSWKYTIKPLAIFLVMLSAVIFYGTQNYGIIFDYGMIQNTLETDYSEAMSYLNIQSVLTILILGVIPSIFIASCSITWQPATKELLQRSKIISVSVVTFFVIAASFYSNYASVGRNNRELVKYIVPFKFIDAGYKYARNNYFTAPLIFKVLDSEPQISLLPSSNKQVFVLVVGETASAGHFSYNGYDKPTNQYSAKFNIKSFRKMSSCGTATAVSVPCMFSLLNQDDFDKRQASSQQNILDLAQLAGVDVLWIDNDSGCKGVCNRVPTIKVSTDSSDPLCDGDYCFDEVLVRGLKTKLNNLSNKSTLIVLHMIGSHGPTYYRRYPKSHQVFMPDCARSDIQNCSKAALTNTYDNTIAYTDFVLSEIITELNALSEKNNINTSMLYISDHGESLGENGIYLHGLPYSFAPEEQTHVPMLYWENNVRQTNAQTVYQQNIQQRKLQNCQNSLLTKPFSHDNISHTVLGRLTIETTQYQAAQDIFSTCQALEKYVKNSNKTKATF